VGKPGLPLAQETRMPRLILVCPAVVLVGCALAGIVAGEV
jgi:hypothetical protein